MRTYHRGNKGEHGGVRSRWLAAHEKWLVPKEIRDRIDRSRSERENFFGRMPAKALAVKGGPQLAADHRSHARPDRRPDVVEEPHRALAAILLHHPSVMPADPTQMPFS